MLSEDTTLRRRLSCRLDSMQMDGALVSGSLRSLTPWRVLEQVLPINYYFRKLLLE